MITNHQKMDINELAVKVLGGVRKALLKLAETSAANNESLVVGDKDGNIKSVPAKELLENLSK